MGCLSYCSIDGKKQHAYGDSHKRKHLIGGVYSFRWIVHSHGGKQTGMALEKQLRLISGSTFSSQREKEVGGEEEREEEGQGERLGLDGFLKSQNLSPMIHLLQ